MDPVGAPSEGRSPVIPHICELVVENYKSIEKLHVRLQPFVALVGPNGAGKSNVIDCLAFVRDCLSDSIELAFRSRGGTDCVLRRSGGRPANISIRMRVALEPDLEADYGLTITAKRRKGFRVTRESCTVEHFMGSQASFDVKEGVFKKGIPGIRPQVSSDRLALYAASATKEFRPVYDFLTTMRFYSGVPARFREPQEPDPGDFLKRDGSNAAAVLKRLMSDKAGGARYERLCRLLSKIVPGLKAVEYRPAGSKETLEFRQDVGQKHPWRFSPLNMSDGTLRVLGLLLSLYQSSPASVIAIEEPEQTVHPAAAELLVEVLLSAAQEKQVLLTTHSPDLLDHKDIGDDQIRVVTAESNKTLVCDMAATTREAVRKRLYTPGELLRLGELEPEVDKASALSGQLSLFSDRDTRGSQSR
jgi:predicted ATPase